MRTGLVVAITVSFLLAFAVACGDDEKAAPMIPSPAGESDDEAEEWEEPDEAEEGEADEGDGEGADDGRPRVSASLEVTPPDYVGPCPVTLTFAGTIALEVGSGTVLYQLVKSDTPPGPIRTLTFDSPGTEDVSLSMTTDTSQSGWTAISILAPEELESNRANYTIDCEGGPGEDCPDSDTDTVCDDDDNCPESANPSQRDFDGDGVGNACDGDDDNDGFSDADEVLTGSDDLDAASVPEHRMINRGSCADGADNDGDTLIDNDDDSCAVRYE